jgi:hypothetical protein
LLVEAKPVEKEKEDIQNLKVETNIRSKALIPEEKSTLLSQIADSIQIPEEFESYDKEEKLHRRVTFALSM